MRGSETETIVYVAPYGQDGGAGTLEEPVRSLEEALARTRAFPGGNKRIVVREGCYYDVSLTLTREDAGLSIEAYPGEHPVLYGGSLVTNWEKDGPFLSAALDGVGDRSRDFRLIEVNGDWRQRARLPEAGAYRHFSEFHVDWLSTFAGGWRREPTEEELTTLKFNGEDIGPWLDVRNAEVTVYHEWDESLVGLDRIDFGSNTMRFSNGAGFPPGSFIDRNENARKYVVWNVKEGLKRPGQWYLDRTKGRLVYWPMPSEQQEHQGHQGNLEHLHAVAPSREQILSLQPGADRLRFKGLTFACAATALNAGGFGSIEAGGAITGHEVNQVVFENVTVRNTGGWAIKLTGTEIRLDGCHIHHTGAGGVYLKGKDILLENSRIHDVGLVYTSAVGVSTNGSSHVIRHNEIYNTPYSGIISGSPDTTVTGNVLYHTMTFMKDGAAIYFAHSSQNVTISGNAVFSGSDDPVRRYAYYLDERCQDCSVENNLAVNLGFPMLSHMTTNCKFVHNIFLDNGPQTVSVLNSWGTVFDQNILIAESIAIHSPQGNPSGLPSEYDSHAYMSRYSASTGITSLKNNVFHSLDGPILFKEYLHYKLVREIPLEELGGNIIADPLFKNAAAGDFSFESDSPAHSAGIHSLSFTDAACSGSGRFSELFARFYR